MDLKAETGAVVNGKCLKVLLASCGTEVGLWVPFSSTYVEVQVWPICLILVCVN